MNSYSQPILRADGNSVDFLDINYKNEVEPTAGGGEARVTNVLHGSNAGILQNLVDNEEAEWVIEIRSPAVLYSKSHHTREAIKNVTWDINETGRHIPVFIISGLVTIRKVAIPTECFNEVWKDEETFTFAQGTYLARGIIFSAEPLLSSMLEFQCDDEARPGTMRIEGPNEHIKFAVYLAKNIYTEIHRRRDVWVAALIGALAKFNPKDHDPDESRVLREISLRLNEKGISDWRDEDYDPVAAATCLEPFYPIFEGE